MFDFSWEQNALEQFKEVLVVQPTDLVDKQFNYVANLTNEYIADSQEDTAPLRECMRFYTEHIFGVHHDDYDYSQVNLLGWRKLKIYLKKVVTLPQSLTKEDYEQLGVREDREGKVVKTYNFTPEEKCHVNLLAIESKKRCALTYLAKAISDYKNL